MEACWTPLMPTINKQLQFRNNQPADSSIPSMFALEKCPEQNLSAAPFYCIKYGFCARSNHDFDPWGYGTQMGFKKGDMWRLPIFAGLCVLI